MSNKVTDLPSNLNANEGLYKNLYFMIEEGVVIFEMIFDDQGEAIDFIIKDMNSTIEEQFDTNSKKAINKSLKELLGVESIPFIHICKRVLKSRLPEFFEDKKLNPGKIYKISVIPGSDNYFAVIFSDITQSKLHEEELKISEEKYRLIVENANDGILISQNDTFIYYNNRFAEMLDYSPEEFHKITFRDIYTKNGLKELHNRNMQRNFGEKLPNYYETSFTKKNGDVINVDVNYQIINYRDHPATFAIVRDITQQKQSELDLKRALEKAKESDHLKSAFLANMSHEIRTPMNGIMGFTRLLRKKGLSIEKHNEYLDVIEHSSKRMLNLINDLIDISKIEAKQVKIFNSHIDVNELLSYLENFFMPECKNKNIKLKKVCKSDLNLLGDKDKLEVILSNLIKNAIKFTDKGQIKFGCEKRFNSLLFYVEDTGIGIPKEKHEEIFKRFIQADDRISKPYEGAGLGLSICKAYVELMKGELKLISEPNNGSRFYFTIPLTQKDDIIDIPQKQSSPTKTKDTSKLNILIAEDDMPSFLYLNIIMQNFAENIIHAPNGKEAVRICKENPDLDLIMMDLKMPIMDGYTATKTIREFNKDIIILAQTAYAFDDDHEKIIQSGFSGHLTKPIQENEVKKLLLELFK